LDAEGSHFSASFWSLVETGQRIVEVEH